eukprot:NODE_2901_length_2124_cov_14.278418.p1 GENE.NODE_2901_length_2124_cov_14.278418~~NODE_2901_length_2124_cov_14.278418.p1  ORF type:complete len:621 (+),score=212.95 NODE_2901_length_2124_cov_14.278418:238-1863(+)
MPAASASTTTTAPSAKYRKMDRVGVGAYGSVYKAERVETDEVVAIKVTSRVEDPVLGGFPLSLLREIGILRRVSHESIVQMYEVAATPEGNPLIVMEFCQASLLELLHSPRHDLSFSEVKYIIRQVLDATACLHRHGVLHRDLATKNVLFNLSGEVKVCDFGISRMAFGNDEELGYVSATELEDPNMVVSLPYRAIELLLGERRYGPALDIWAVGCILGEILLCKSGRLQTLFGGDPARPNKTPQMVVEDIFNLLGRSTEETWPGFTRLPLLKALSSAKTACAVAHTATNAERIRVRRFFLSGDGACAHAKYCLTESCFDLFAGLLSLCPDRRVTAEEAAKHGFFGEKPAPEWHAWHWAKVSSEIPRGDDMRRQGSAEDTRRLLRELSRRDSEKVAADDEAAARSHISLKERTREALEKRAERAQAAAAAKEKAAERRAAAVVAAAAAKQKALQAAAAAATTRAGAGAGARATAPGGERGGSGGGGGSGGATGGDSGAALLPGWTKHWSQSRNRYYYHDESTGANQWHAPSAAGGTKARRA